jgi:hypothetical protein
MAKDQKNAIRLAKARMEDANHSQTTLLASDEVINQPYFVYIINVLNREWFVEQPPLFSSYKIPACPKGQKFSWNKLGAFIMEPYTKPGTFDTFYTKVDGRKVATSLLNPSAFPGTVWESQLQNWDAPDQFGNNLNAFGVFWTLSDPNDPADAEALDEEVRIFKERSQRTLNELIRAAEQLAAQNDLKSISPLMHYAMDYFGKQAPWHMAAEHMVACPNCGDLVKDGIAYHKNSFGEKCIIDAKKYTAMIRAQKAAEAAAMEPEPELPPIPATMSSSVTMGGTPGTNTPVSATGSSSVNTTVSTSAEDDIVDQEPSQFKEPELATVAATPRKSAAKPKRPKYR